MGSYQQAIVGGMLLVVAFFFGRYITDHPVDHLAEAETSLEQASPTQPETLQAKLTPPKPRSASQPNALQRSLRDRILGDRARGQEQPANSKREAANQIVNNASQQNLFAANEIIEPDFSHLEAEPLASSQPQSLENPTLLQQNMLPDTQRPIQKNSTPEQNVTAGKFTIKRPANPDQRPYSINRPAKDTLTKRGTLNVVRPDGRLVPVQRKRNQNTFKDREFVSYTTVFGDTLHSLSNKFFGKPDYYLDIYLANRELFDNPSAVPLNTTIRIPVKSQASN